MTEEEKRDLIVLDISGRIPYGVYVLDEYRIDPEDEEKKIEDIIVKVYSITGWGEVEVEYKDGCWSDKMGYPFYKPILRLYEDLTPEEIENLGKIKIDWKRVDYMNKIMLDYRGLIEKGLAYRKGHYDKDKLRDTSKESD